MIKFEENVNWFPSEVDRISDALISALYIPYSHLYSSLGRHSTTGNDWTEKYPDEMFARSSNAEALEYPQMQTGELREDLDVVVENDLSLNIGFFDGNMKKFMYLEFGRMTLSGDMMVSPADYGPLYMTFEGKDSQEVISSMTSEFVSELGSR